MRGKHILTVLNFIGEGVSSYVVATEGRGLIPSFRKLKREINYPGV